jgi:hypothetical protein
VILVLNYFEHVRFSLLNNRIDKDLFKASLSETIIKILVRFKPYIDKRDKQLSDDLKQLEDLLK